MLPRLPAPTSTAVILRWLVPAAAAAAAAGDGGGLENLSCATSSPSLRSLSDCIGKVRTRAGRVPAGAASLPGYNLAMRKEPAVGDARCATPRL